MRELRELFAHFDMAITDLSQLGVPEIPDEAGIESWDTFEENAIAKAQYFHSRTGLATFADDSGLSVDVLGGSPGVHSKRWSGRTDIIGTALDDANNAKLMAELRQRVAFPATASYVCAAAFVDDTRSLVRIGAAAGRIVSERRGTGGFGYDPHFISDELGESFAEATTAAKLHASHRGRAFKALLDALAQPD